MWDRVSFTVARDRYRVISLLGSGGFGRTFLAEDTDTPSQRRVVIKQLKPISHNPQIYQLVQERFQREAAVLEQLGEENLQIPQLYAYFTNAGLFYLVQQWIDGETLTDKVHTQGNLDESTVRNILVNILEVLDYVHSKGIIHRDIKPDNIILRRRDSNPVLIDFGAVKETMGTVVNSQGTPTSSIVIGTPGFMPNEQAAGKPVRSSDLYSLGLTAVYALTGKIPQELPLDQDTGEIRWHDEDRNISQLLLAVLDKVICSYPNKRYSSAKDMLTALQASTQTIQSTPHSPTPSTIVSLPPPLPSPPLTPTPVPPIIVSPQSTPSSVAPRWALGRGIVIGAFAVIAGVASLTFLNRTTPPSSKTPIITESPSPTVSSAPSPGADSLKSEYGLHQTA